MMPTRATHTIKDHEDEQARGRKRSGAQSGVSGRGADTAANSINQQTETDSEHRQTRRSAKRRTAAARGQSGDEGSRTNAADDEDGAAAQKREARRTAKRVRRAYTDGAGETQASGEDEAGCEMGEVSPSDGDCMYDGETDDEGAGAKAAATAANTKRFADHLRSRIWTDEVIHTVVNYLDEDEDTAAQNKIAAGSGATASSKRGKNGPAGPEIGERHSDGGGASGAADESKGEAERGLDGTDEATYTAAQRQANERREHSAGERSSGSGDDEEDEDEDDDEDNEGGSDGDDDEDDGEDDDDEADEEETEGMASMFEDREDRTEGLFKRGEAAWASQLLRARADQAHVISPAKDNWSLHELDGEWTEETKTAWKQLTEYIPADDKPAREWSVRRLLDGWAANSYIKKWLSKTSSGMRCGALDVFWAAVAYGQDISEVDQGVERHEFSERTVRYCHGWRVQLQAAGELFEATEARGEYYGLSYEQTIAIYATLVARGADWHPQPGRQIRRSNKAVSQTVHEWSGGSKQLASSAIRSFIFARMAAGDLHVEDGVPHDSTLALHELTNRQLRVLQKLREGAVVGMDAPRTYEVGTLMRSRADESAPNMREQRRHTLVLLGVAESKEPTAKDGGISVSLGPGKTATDVHQVAEHHGIQCLVASAYGDGPGVLTLDDMVGTDNDDAAVAKRIVDLALPHGAVEVVLGDPSTHGRAEYEAEAKQVGVDFSAIAAELLKSKIKHRVRVVAFESEQRLERMKGITGRRENYDADGSVYVWIRVGIDELGRVGEGGVEHSQTIDSADIGSGMMIYTATSEGARATQDKRSSEDGIRYEARAARRRAWRMKHQRGQGRTRICKSCKATHRLYVDDEHPRGSRRRRSSAKSGKSPFLHMRWTTYCHCVDGEAVLSKPTVSQTNIFPPQRRCRLRVCGVKGQHGQVEVCDHLPIPPGGKKGKRGRHKFIIARDRTMTACGRGVKAIDHKHYVPQMYYAEVAKAIEEQEGECFARNGGVWISACAGSHSDELAALRHGYRYVPIDVREIVRSFGDKAPNWQADLSEVDLYDKLVEILGSEEALLDIVVAHFSVPCETHSVTSAHLHRTASGAPLRGPDGARAREVDSIDDNARAFLSKIAALKRKWSAQPCTCDDDSD